MNEQEKEAVRKKILSRIWVQGIVTSVIFIAIMWLFFDDDYTIPVRIVQFLTFYGTWVIIHYVFYGRQLRQLRKK